MKKSILFIVDKKGWAYDDCAKNWRGLLQNQYDIDILYLEEFSSITPLHSFYKKIKDLQNSALKNESISVQEILDVKKYFIKKNNQNVKVFDHKNYDGIYFFYHRALTDSRLLGTPIPLEKVALAVNNEKWVENGAIKEYIKYMDGVKVIVGCNKFIINEFKKTKAKVLRASQAINPKIFKESREKFISDRINNKVIVGWSGNWSNKIKNFETVRKACQIAGVRFRKEKDLSRKELNKWYNKVDLVICASESEGGPLMLLEAGAVGLPVITTPVGLAREIIKNKKTGIITTKKPEDIANKIKFISARTKERRDMAKALQKEVLNNWTYQSRLYEIKKILKELC